MGKIKHLTCILFFFAHSVTFAQVSVDHAIQLTGAGVNAKINGIRNVTDSLDATSVEVVQNGSLIYAVATGSNNAFSINISPPIIGYQAGMAFNFISNQNITGAATLNVDGQGNIPIKKNISQNIGQCDIQNGQVVTVVYDGTNFQMTSVSVPLVPTTANAGPNQYDNGVSTTTLAANTPVVGTGFWTIISGAGGSISNPTSPTSTFSGIEGNTYILTWTISTCNSSSSSSSNDTITFVSPPVPLTIADLYLWYDANDASTISYSSGTSVSMWADKSGNGYNASNSNTSEQPTLQVSDINGLPAVRFSSSSNQFLVNTAFTMNLANRSIFVVEQDNDPNVCDNGIISIRSASGSDYGSSDGYLFGNEGGGDAKFINNNCCYDIDMPTSSSTSCQLPLAIYTEIVNSGNGIVYFDGSPGGTGEFNNPNSTTSGGGIALGARYHGGGDAPGSPDLIGLDGDIAEIIIYNRTLTSTERDEVGAYLSAKWGVPFTP